MDGRLKRVPAGPEWGARYDAKSESGQRSRRGHQVWGSPGYRADYGLGLALLAFWHGNLDLIEGLPRPVLGVKRGARPAPRPLASLLVDEVSYPVMRDAAELSPRSKRPN